MMTTERDVYCGHLEKVRATLCEPDIYGQLAEECCELAQAALKMQRVLNARNLPAGTETDILDNVVEEISDVKLCLQLLHLNPDSQVMERKAERWCHRLETEHEFTRDTFEKGIDNA